MTPAGRNRDLSLPLTALVMVFLLLLMAGVASSILGTYGEQIADAMGIRKESAYRPRSHRSSGWEQTREIHKRLRETTDPNEKAELCTELLEIRPMSPGVLILRGRLYGQMCRLPESLADLSEAIRIAPYNSEAFYLRGMLHRQLRRFEQADADFCRAIELSPLDARCRALRARTRAELGLCDQALADANMAVLLDPTDADTWLVRATVRSLCGMHKEAESDFRRALQLAPEDARVFADRAMCYLRVGQSASAEKDFRRAARFVRDDQPEVIERLAGYYLRNRKGRVAARLLNRAVGRPGASLEAWCMRARARMALQRPADAMQDVEACLKLSPSYPPAWRIKAELHLAMDQPELARTAALVLRDLGGDLTPRLKELAERPPG